MLRFIYKSICHTHGILIWQWLNCNTRIAWLNWVLISCDVCSNCKLLNFYRVEIVEKIMLVPKGMTEEV